MGQNMVGEMVIGVNFRGTFLKELCEIYSMRLEISAVAVLVESSAIVVPALYWRFKNG